MKGVLPENVNLEILTGCRLTGTGGIIPKCSGTLTLSITGITSRNLPDVKDDVASMAQNIAGRLDELGKNLFEAEAALARQAMR